MVKGAELLNSYIPLDYRSRTDQDQIIDNSTVVIYIKNNKLMWRRGEDAPKEIKISDNDQAPSFSGAITSFFDSVSSL